MTDEEFLLRLKEKIEGITGRTITLVVDESKSDRMHVSHDGDDPEVVIGSAALKYPGFARLCGEYAVACIREGREITPMEFHLTLIRN